MSVDRLAAVRIQEKFEHTDCALLLGPRQVGKTWLAQALGNEHEPPAVYLDLELEAGRKTIENFQVFAEANAGRLIILDEAQCDEAMFPKLKAHLDQLSRDGSIQTKFLLLGSAAAALVSLASQNLGGRMAIVDLTPFQFEELGPSPELQVAPTSAPGEVQQTATAPDLEDAQEIVGKLWLRGGFPRSYRAASDQISIEWRSDYLRTILSAPELLGARLAKPDLLPVLWGHLCTQQGETCISGKIAGEIGCQKGDVEEMLRFLENAQLVRVLRPWFVNERKRERTPARVFIRDSGLLHERWKFVERDQLLADGISGKSWEGFVIEALLNAVPQFTNAFFYLDEKREKRKAHAGGNTDKQEEIDLVVELSPKKFWAFEIKLTDNPTVSAGFYRATENVGCAKRFVVHGGPESIVIGSKEPVDALSFPDALDVIGSA